jgi:hypothetical protein
MSRGDRNAGVEPWDAEWAAERSAEALRYLGRNAPEVRMIGKERNSGKFTRAKRERPAAETENALLAKTMGVFRGRDSIQGGG